MGAPERLPVPPSSDGTSPIGPGPDFSFFLFLVRLRLVMWRPGGQSFWLSSILWVALLRMGWEASLSSSGGASGRFRCPPAARPPREFSLGRRGRVFRV